MKPPTQGRKKCYHQHEENPVTISVTGRSPERGFLITKTI